MKNIINVMTGKFSWVGYIPGDPDESDLPVIRKGVLHAGMFFGTMQDSHQIRQLNIMYAKDYRLLSDLEILIRYWKNLDNHVK
jgi:hypothetical protein